MPTLNIFSIIKNILHLKKNCASSKECRKQICSWNKLQIMYTYIYAIKIRWTDFLKCTQLVSIKQEVQYMFIDVIKLYMICIFFMDNESIGY